MSRHHPEKHRTHRSGWLRAAVLGANDGIVSTASLLVGVASASVSHENVMIAGVAGLVAGAMSMAAGEYVSVSSQADIERADLAKEAQEQIDNPEYEHQELADIYRERGLSKDLAHRVATELMEHDALGAHARDEIGISRTVRARPLLAAMTSAATFSVGASVPLLIAWITPLAQMPITVALASLLCLCVLGALAARTGGARIGVGALRVAFWGALAMALTAWIGTLFGAAPH
ncbi:MAG: VIT family protein [Pseudomonadales bacterium]